MRSARCAICQRGRDYRIHWDSESPPFGYTGQSMSKRTRDSRTDHSGSISRPFSLALPSVCFAVQRPTSKSGVASRLRSGSSSSTTLESGTSDFRTFQGSPVCLAQPVTDRHVKIKVVITASEFKSDQAFEPCFLPVRDRVEIVDDLPDRCSGHKAGMPPAAPCTTWHGFHG